MDRRRFLSSTVALAGGFMASRAIAADRLLSVMPPEMKRKLADAGLEAAKAGGAHYCDIRIGRYLTQDMSASGKGVRKVGNNESVGIGVRVLLDGVWGFSATNSLTAEAVRVAAADAVDVAKANRLISTVRVDLIPAPSTGEIFWKTKIIKNAMAVPVQEKLDILLDANAAAVAAGANFIESSIRLINEQKYFASSEGSYIDQDIHRVVGGFMVTAIDKITGAFRTRGDFAPAKAMGFEYFDADRVKRFVAPNGVITYDGGYDMREDAVAAARQATEMLKAPSVKPGRYDLVTDPTHNAIILHETVAHALELDRVMGMEANFAGTSFATLDKWRDGYRYGSDHVTIFADRLQPTTMGEIAFDDEGVESQRWNLIEKGKLTSYITTREQAATIGDKASHGCAYANSWRNVQIPRMSNVSLAPGDEKMSVADMISNVENGIYVVGWGTYSIDQQRYNAQFGGQVCYEIKNGALKGQLGDVAYQLRTPEFWNSCAGVCDRSDYRVPGMFGDGKGEPVQMQGVSHGSSTARFNGISVLNTARSLG